MNEIIKYWWSTSRGGGYTKEYKAVLAAMGSEPITVASIGYNLFIKTLVNGGVWDKLDQLVFLDRADNILNWINPGTNDPSVVSNGGSLTHSLLEGAITDGSAYIDLNYNPTNDAVNYSQDSASIIAISNTDANEATFALGVNDGNNDCFIRLRNGGSLQARINGSSNINNTIAVDDSLGLNVGNRILSTHQELWKEGVRLVQGADESVGIPNANFYGLCWNNEGSPAGFVTKQILLLAIGGGLTPDDQLVIKEAKDALYNYIDGI